MEQCNFSYVYNVSGVELRVAGVLFLFFVRHSEFSLPIQILGSQMFPVYCGVLQRPDGSTGNTSNLVLRYRKMISSNINPEESRISYHAISMHIYASIVGMIRISLSLYIYIHT